MPRSEFHRELAVASMPERTWETLTDVPLLVSWITVLDDAVELERLARYSAVLLDRLGPFKLRADLDIAVHDVRPGEFIAIKASGEDRQVGSRLTVEARMTVTPREDDGTDVAFRGFYEVTGRVAAMGSGSINKKADKILDDFFGSVSSTLGEA